MVADADVIFPESIKVVELLGIIPGPVGVDDSKLVLPASKSPRLVGFEVDVRVVSLTSVAGTIEPTVVVETARPSSIVVVFAISD